MNIKDIKIGDRVSLLDTCGEHFALSIGDEGTVLELFGKYAMVAWDFEADIRVAKWSLEILENDEVAQHCAD